MTYELMDQELTQQLIDYRLAWPIILALQKKGARHLIQILNEAQEDALTAFSRLTSESDLALLIDVFLVKTSPDLERIDRVRLIQFLRQPGYLDTFLSQERFFLLVEQCLEGSTGSNLELQQRSKELLFLFYSESEILQKAPLLLARVSALFPTKPIDLSQSLVSEETLAERYGANCLKDFLIHYHNKPGFTAGLDRFVTYAKHYKKAHLLSDALALLVNTDNGDDAHTILTDTVLQRLIATDEIADIVLRLIDNNSLEMNKVASFFTKRQVMTVLQALNKRLDWEDCALYPLILKILEVQYTSLFPAKDFSHGHMQSWSRAELKELVQFIRTHLSKKTSLDNHHALGYKILAELIFRCAHLGETALFYANKTLDHMMTHLSFTRPLLERLIDSFWIPGGVKELFANRSMRIKTWLTDGSVLHKELAWHRGITDWRHLIKQTWQATDKNKLPIICVYLLNYSGSKKPLAGLLHDYFMTFQNTPNCLYPVVKLLQQFPARAVSAVIFDELEKVLIQNPHMLDDKILTDMAFYYVQNRAKPEETLPEMDFLVYLGRNKQYMLLQKGCELLAQKTEDKSLRKRLLKAAKEAQVEADLNLSSASPYFSLIKWVKRLWHYGSAKNTSGMLAWCDEEGPISSGNPDEQMTIPPLNDKMSPIYLEFSEKRKQLIRLLTTISHSSVDPSLVPLSSYGTQTLFGGGLDVSVDNRTRHPERLSEGSPDNMALS